MAVNHYENFPVASVLLPTHLRRPVELIYAFARQADDFADEGDCPASVRLASLAGFGEQLDVIESGATPSSPLFVELAGIIQDFELPIDLFRDLLSAFSQDVVKTRYGSWDAGVGAEIESGKHDFASLESYMLKKGDAEGLKQGIRYVEPRRRVVVPPDDDDPEPREASPRTG